MHPDRLTVADLARLDQVRAYAEEHPFDGTTPIPIAGAQGSPREAYLSCGTRVALYAITYQGSLARSVILDRPAGQGGEVVIAWLSAVLDALGFPAGLDEPRVQVRRYPDPPRGILRFGVLYPAPPDAPPPGPTGCLGVAYREGVRDE